MLSKVFLPHSLQTQNMYLTFFSSSELKFSWIVLSAQAKLSVSELVFELQYMTFFLPLDQGFIDLAKQFVSWSNI